MILADKIIDERKKCGYSQEELAEKLHVSRQSISKWESAQSVPDLSRIIKMSEIFSVSTDYLLKDELGNEARAELSLNPQEHSESADALRVIGMDEAAEYLQQRHQASAKIALATLLCILSPVALLLFGAASENELWLLSENVAGAIGMILLLLLVGTAVAIYITVGQKNTEYEFLETESFETSYGVTGMVRDVKKQYREKYSKYNVYGTLLCIFSILPLFVSLIIDSSNEMLMMISAAFMFLFVAVGVFFFIFAGVHFASVEKLLQEGDYTRRKKTPLYRMTTEIYWLVATAIFFIWSFSTNAWEITWLVWVVAGVLYPAVLALAETLSSKK